MIALVLGLLAGFFGRATDSILSRLMDLIWAFPVYLLAISLATVLLTKANGLQWGPIHIDPASRQGLLPATSLAVSPGARLTSGSGS